MSSKNSIAIVLVWWKFGTKTIINSIKLERKTKFRTKKKKEKKKLRRTYKWSLGYLEYCDRCSRRQQKFSKWKTFEQIVGQQSWVIIVTLVCGDVSQLYWLVRIQKYIWIKYHDACIIEVREQNKLKSTRSGLLSMLWGNFKQFNPKEKTEHFDKYVLLMLLLTNKLKHSPRLTSNKVAATKVEFG